MKMAKKFILKYRNKSGIEENTTLDADNFYDAEIEALEELKKEKNNINFSKNNNINLVKKKHPNDIVYEAIWIKISPLSNVYNSGGYIEGFVLNYSKKEKKELNSFFKGKKNHRLRILKVFTLLYQLVALLILADLMLDLFIESVVKREWIDKIGLEQINISILLQSTFLILLIIASIFQPIAYEDYRSSFTRWRELRKKLIIYEIPALISTLATALSLIFSDASDSIVLWGGYSTIYIFILLLVKIILTIGYEKGSFYHRKKLEIHNKVFD